MSWGSAPYRTSPQSSPDLADAILEVSYQRIRSELTAEYGVPCYLDPGGASRECGMAVIALGKLGGQELNYSSDIDLMFIYAAHGETAGPKRISNKEFYKKVANRYTALLSAYTQHGLCYRVDLRLRPDGTLGEVCSSAEGARHYYQTRARDWELQMLIKARVAAGDEEVGKSLLDAVEPLIYATTLDFRAIESVSLTRQRISEKLRLRRTGPGASNVKLARGGIRDIEFLVQCLQRLYGGRAPWVRHAGTLLALARLHDKQFLSPAEYGRLSAAYTFLRNLEHRLQFEDDRQTHTLPSEPQLLDSLSRKMPDASLHGNSTAESLLAQLHAHLEAVRELYERVIHAQPSVQPSSVLRSLDRQAPALARQVGGTSPRLGRAAVRALP